VTVQSREFGWDEHQVALGEGLREASEIRFRVAGARVLWVDDLILFQP
jgi:hypothetical protein